MQIIYSMKIVYNNFIPFRGYAAINLFGVVFARKGVMITDRTINHESIHTKQMKETGYIIFYVWYLVEWIIRLFMPGNAYRNISFEREAYANEKDKDYLNNRKFFSWIKYLKA